MPVWSCFYGWQYLPACLPGQGPTSETACTRFPTSVTKCWNRSNSTDGLVDEWYELVGEPTLSLLDFTEELYQSPLDPSDIDFRIWLAWHDEPARLYVGLVASDDVYKNTHDYSSSRDVIHFHDSIVLAIDGDHSGGVGYSNSDPLEERIEGHWASSILRGHFPHRQRSDPE